METIWVDLDQVEENTGQIEGVPANPRNIKSDKFNKLVKSLQESPDMMELREAILYDNGGIYVSIAGNQRVKAAKKADWTQIPAKVLPQETDKEKIKEIAIKDNNNFGDFDYEMLKDEWEIDSLVDWGVDIDVEEAEEDKEASKYDDNNCVYPIIPRFDEKYKAVIVICKTETEIAQVKTKLNVPEKAQGYKNSYLGNTFIVEAEDTLND